MSHKIQTVIENAYNKINQDFDEYIKYLRVIGNNYKYEAAMQLNIYSLNPKAKACATYEFWRKNFNRAVMYKEKGIPIYVMKNGQKKVNYIFDVSQTRAIGKKEKKPRLWKFERESHGEIFERITGIKNFEEGEKELIKSNLSEEFTEDIKSFIEKSALVAINQRLGIDTEDIFDEKDREIYALIKEPEKLELIFFEISEITKKVLTAVSKEIQKIENELTKTLRSIMMLQENYPDLKANENFLSLQSQLSQIETEIQSSRKYYNGTARDRNTFVETFPNNIIGGFLGFKKAEFFNASEGAERAPEVKF